MSVVMELAINFGIGLGIIVAAALAVFLWLCAHSWASNDYHAPRWAKIVGSLVIILTALTLLGYCVRYSQ